MVDEVKSVLKFLLEEKGSLRWVFFYGKVLWWLQKKNSWIAGSPRTRGWQRTKL